MPTELIAITGGIGSGKSVVCHVLSAMGYAVYDCDSRAKAIMDEDEEIHRLIGERISPECIADGCINRQALAAIVFEDRGKLAELNSIVHGAVRDDIRRWRASLRSPFAFVETAILYESQLDRMVTEVWTVDAPADIRIGRVIRRSGLTMEQVESRIKSQNTGANSVSHPSEKHLLNDDVTPLLPQIERLIGMHERVRGASWLIKFNTKHF